MPLSPRSRRTARGRPSKVQRDAYLAVLRQGLTITEAAETAGRDKDAFDYLRKADAEFAALHDQAVADGADVLVAEAFRRAVTGLDDVKVVGQGAMAERVEFKTYSDRMLELLLKAKLPQMFRENVKVEQVGKDDGPIQTETTVRGVALADVLDFAQRIRPAASSDD